MILSPNIFTILLYNKDDYLDFILSRCIESGLKDIKSSERFYATITFNNGIEYTYWNANKYHAWLSEGRIGNYNYYNCRPSRKTMRKFRKLLAGENLSN